MFAGTADEPDIEELDDRRLRGIAVKQLDDCSTSERHGAQGILCVCCAFV